MLVPAGLALAAGGLQLVRSRRGRPREFLAGIRPKGQDRAPQQITPHSSGWVDSVRRRAGWL